jgi:hypothetical protein
MSTNASSLRRVLRSIGSHATPTSHINRSFSASTNTCAASQVLGRPAKCHHGSQHSRRYASSPRCLDVQRQKEAATQSPQPIPNQAPSDGPRKESEHGDGDGDGVLVVRRVQARPPPHQIVRKMREPIKTDPVFKEKRVFKDRYFLASKAQDNERMKAQARRHQLMAERHEFSERKAWHGTVKVLQQDSPEGAKNHKKRMETIRLPEGIFARWLRDPGESILEVMQRTGSHVQVVPGQDVGLFYLLRMQRRGGYCRNRTFWEQ